MAPWWRDREAACPPAGGAPSCRPAPGEQRALSLIPSPARTSPSRERRVCVTTPVKRKRGEGQWKLGLPRAAQPERAHQEGRRRAERPGPDRERLHQARVRLHRSRPTCAAGCAGGASTPSASRASTAAAPRCWSPRSSTTATSCCASGIDGGALTTEQLRTLGEISQTYARDTADVTDRQNIQYHWIEIEDMPAIWQRLESVGHEHHGGVRRHAPRDPRLAGRRHRRGRGDRPAPGDRRDPRALHRQPRVLQPAAQVQDRDLRGSRTSRTRSTTSPSSASCTPSTGRASTCGSAAGSRPTRRSRSASAPGCRSTRSRTSGRASSRSSATTATGGCGTARGSSSWWPTGAPRSSARCWRASTCSRTLVDGPAPEIPASPIDHVGVHKQRDGRNYVGVAPAVGTGLRHHAGRRWPTPPSAPARAGCGSPRSRRSSCSTSRTRGRRAHRASSPTLGLQAEPSPWRRATMACTGIEFCKLAIVETKERAIRLVDELEKRLADVYPGRADLDPPQRLPERLRPHPGRRHRPQGHDRHRPRAATRSRASRCTSAAGWASTPGSGASCAGSRSPAPTWATTSTAWCGATSSSATAGERFAQWVARADEADLK